MINSLANKRIILGLTGSIAAYKSAELVRLLRDSGADVRVIMTRAACEFITPMTMQALSGKPVHLELMDLEMETAMGHIELARWADITMVAPASANFIAKLAHGQANDLLSTLCLVSENQIMIAPAMNQQMWLNPATQHNIAILKDRGIVLCGPAEGGQACGETGPGRMLEPQDLVKTLVMEFSSDILSGQQVLVTAGPTREAIDPVRFISNRSSGKMGFAIARAASEAGAVVTLVSGPTTLHPPERMRYIPVESAREMYEEVMREIDHQDIFIAAAAVADYQYLDSNPVKIKKNRDKLTLTLDKSPDILAKVAGLPRPPYTVGFAAETHDLEMYAREKLFKKNLDMIAANLVGDGMGFERDENEIQLYWKNGEKNLERASKDKLARQIIKFIAEQFHAKSGYVTH